MRTHRLIVFLLLSGALLAAVKLYAEPTFAFSQRVFFPAVSAYEVLPGKGYVACLVNGDCSLVSTNGTEILRRHVSVYEMIFLRLLPERNVLVGVDEKGIVYFLNASTLDPIDSFTTSRSDENYVEGAALSRDGRFLALKVKYTLVYNNNKYSEARLAVVDLQLRKRVFERDLSTANDKLVEIFSLGFAGNYLVTETIDTKCELCQYTDNKIEVYRVDENGATKLASFQSGMTVKAIFGGFLVAQRVQANQTGDHLTYVFRLPNLEIVAKKQLPRVRTFIPFGNDSFLALFSNGALKLCNPNLDCRDLLTVPERALVASDGEDLLVFTAGNIDVYSYTGALAKTGSQQVSWSIAPSPPSSAVARKGSYACLYGDNMVVAAFKITSVKLTIRVLDEAGNILPGAQLIIRGKGGPLLRNAEQGVVQLELPPGVYEVSVARQGFSPVDYPLNLTSDTFLELRLSREAPKRVSVVVAVFGETGEPLPEANVKLVGPEVVSTRTDSRGYAGFNVPIGNYTVIVEAGRYERYEGRISVGANFTDPIRVTLKLKRAEVSLRAVGDGVQGVKVYAVSMSTGEKFELPLNGTRALPLDAYSLLVNSSGDTVCNVTGSVFALSEGSNLTLILRCGKISLARLNPEPVVNILSNKTISGRRLNMTLDLRFDVTLYNSSTLSLRDVQRGRILVIEFFYTQCTGCKYLLPVLKRIAESGNATVVSLSVSPLDTNEVLRRYIEENNVTWLVGRAGDDLVQAFNVSAFPTVVVIDGDRVVFVGMGAKEELESAQKALTLAWNLTALLNPLRAGTLLSPETLMAVGGFITLAALMLGGGRDEEELSKESSLNSDTSALLNLSDSVYSPYIQALEIPRKEDSGEVDPGVELE